MTSIRVIDTTTPTDLLSYSAGHKLSTELGSKTCLKPVRHWISLVCPFMLHVDAEL